MNQVMVQIQAMFEAGVDFWTVKVSQAIKAPIIGEINGIGFGWIRGDAGVFQHAAVEDQFEHIRVRPVPTMGVVVGFLAKAMV